MACGGTGPRSKGSGGGGAVTERGKLTGVCREDKSYAECSLF